MRKALFYTFLFLFAATAIVTILALIGIFDIEEGYLKALFTTFIIEVGVGVVALFKETNFFGDKQEKKDLRLKSLPDRKEYISEQRSSISSAKKRVILSMSKLHPESESKDAQIINSAIREASGKGVQIKILVGATVERLPGAIPLAKLENIDIRFDPTLTLADVNYLCVGSNKVITGVRKVEKKAGNYSQSLEWYQIMSNTMVRAIMDIFEQHWNAPATMTMEQMLRRYLPSQIETSGVDGVANQFGLSNQVIANYTNPSPFFVLIIGRPGSGKTSISKSLLSALLSANIQAAHYTDVDFLYENFKNQEEQGKIYKRIEEGGYLVTDETLYDRATQYLVACAQEPRKGISLIILEMARRSYIDAINILIKKKVNFDFIVYVDVNLEIAKIRNRWRQNVDGMHFVSEEEMDSTFSEDDIGEVK